MRKNQILIPLMAMLTMSVSAQKIKVNNPEINLGQVRYCVPATATFTMKNTGALPVAIKDVDTGCGCTTVSYPKGEIAPGQEFQFSVTYDAKLLGHFTRVVTIFDDSASEPFDVTVNGQVVMNVENYTGEYPEKLGDLYADRNFLEFDDVYKGEKQVQDIHIINPTGQYVEPVVMHLPAYLRADVSPKRLAPKQAGVIHFTLNGAYIHSSGLNQASIYLGKQLGEKVSEDKEIEVSAVLLPQKNEPTAQELANSPRMELSTALVDFHDFGGKAKKKVEILVSNKGKSDLKIETMQMFTPGLEVTLPKRTLRPGESTKMKITGIADVIKKLRTRPRILMITNDFNLPKVIIEVRK